MSTFLYLISAFLPILNSQSPERIHYSAIHNDSNWNASKQENGVTWSEFESCDKTGGGKCVWVRAGSAIEQTFPTTDYHSIYIIIDVRLLSLEQGEKCVMTIFGDTEQMNFTLLLPPSDQHIGARRYLSDTNDYNNQSNFRIRLGTIGDGTDDDLGIDSCSFGNLQVWGTPYNTSSPIAASSTYEPSVNPTQNPSVSTTDSPSQYPSTQPSVSPSELPTDTPTISPLQDGAVDDSKNDDPEEKSGEHSGAETSEPIDSTLIIIGAIAVLFCVLICCIGFFLYKKKTKNIQKNEDSQIQTKPSQLNLKHKNKRDDQHMAMAIMGGHKSSDFEGDLNNLQTANNILMDDIVDDMENGDMNDGVTAGGGDEHDVNPLDDDIGEDFDDDNDVMVSLKTLDNDGEKIRESDSDDEIYADAGGGGDRLRGHTTGGYDGDDGNASGSTSQHAVPTIY